jgi:uncharacterized membrane protein YtjA (UPF0391 family)
MNPEAYLETRPPFIEQPRRQRGGAAGNENHPYTLSAGTDNGIGDCFMLKWALIFFIISIIAGLFGFTGISAATAGIAKILFAVFLIIAIIWVIVAFAVGAAVF